MCNCTPQFDGHLVLALEGPGHGAALLAPQPSPMSLDVPGVEEIDAVLDDVPPTAQSMAKILKYRLS